jgi:hypothetical protein
MVETLAYPIVVIASPPFVSFGSRPWETSVSYSEVRLNKTQKPSLQDTALRVSGRELPPARGLYRRRNGSGGDYGRVSAVRPLLRCSLFHVLDGGRPLTWVRETKRGAMH